MHVGKHHHNTVRAERQRKRLLALVAGTIAGGVVAVAYDEVTNEATAEQSVNIAEAILRKVGL